MNRKRNAYPIRPSGKNSCVFA